MKILKMKLWIYYTELILICFQVNITTNDCYRKVVNFDIYYRDPKKFFSTLRNSLPDWRKTVTILEKQYKKEKLNVQQGTLALFRRRQDVTLKDECDKEL